jgi:hypothetical protein
LVVVAYVARHVDATGCEIDTAACLHRTTSVEGYALHNTSDYTDLRFTFQTALEAKKTYYIGLEARNVNLVVGFTSGVARCFSYMRHSLRYVFLFLFFI